MSKAMSERAHIEVTAEPDTELFLIAGNLSLAASGVGRLKASVAPGLYKIRSIRAGNRSEKFIELNPGESKREEIAATVLTTTGPSPGVLGADVTRFFDYVAEVNANAAALPQSDEPAGRPIYIFASDETGSGRNPMRGLRIFPWHDVGEAIALSTHQDKTVTAGGRVWAGIKLLASARPHVAQLTVGNRDVRLVVPNLAQYETRLYVRRRRWIDAAATMPPNFGAKVRPDSDWIDFAIHVRGGPVLFSDITETGTNLAAAWSDQEAPDLAETEHAVRVALANRRKIAIDSEVVNRVLRQKFTDPYAGLAGAHLMFDAIEKKDRYERLKRSSDTTERINFSPNYVNTVIRNLCRLFDYDLNGQVPPDDPDLTAILLRADRSSARQIKLTRPPVYWRSWETLRNHAAASDEVWIEPRLWSETKLAAAWGAYFGWRPHRMSADRFVKNIAWHGSADSSRVYLEGVAQVEPPDRIELHRAAEHLNLPRSVIKKL